jgi:hypothetical protein
LHDGKLLAQVPHRAIGFCINTPSLDVVDLGTEFGVEAMGRGQTVVQVFRGLAEVTQSVANRQLPPSPLRLSAGQAVTGNAQEIGPIGRAGDAAQFITRLAPADGGRNDGSEFELDFATDPGWTGVNNTSHGSDYGYQAKSRFAGGALGEVGGRFTKSIAESFYGDTHLSHVFTLDDTLYASGKFNFQDPQNWNSSGRSGLIIGYFSASTAEDRHEFIGLQLVQHLVTDDTRVQAMLSMHLATHDAPDVVLEPMPIEGNYTFTMTYDPRPDLTHFPSSDGRLTITIKGSNGYNCSAAIDDIGRSTRLRGAQFDTFGISVNGKRNDCDEPDKRIGVFLDDVHYSGFVPRHTSRTN